MGSAELTRKSTIICTTNSTRNPRVTCTRTSVSFWNPSTKKRTVVLVPRCSPTKPKPAVLRPRKPRPVALPESKRKPRKLSRLPWLNKFNKTLACFTIFVLIRSDQIILNLFDIQFLRFDFYKKKKKKKKKSTLLIPLL